MKKLSFLFFIIVFISACNDNTGNKSTDSKQNSEAAKTNGSATEADDPEADKAIALIAKNGCLACHKVDEPFTGPAYTAVAAKYENTDAVVDTLAQKIIKGGSGNWGTVPMIAHPSLSPEDAKTIVHYVLSLKK
jgi:cytochrome c